MGNKYNGLKAFVSGGLSYKALPLQHGTRQGTRVRTFAGPRSAAMFAAGSVGHGGLAAQFTDGGDVMLLDRDGNPLPHAKYVLASLLSDDEVRLLQLFGVDMRKLANTKLCEKCDAPIEAPVLSSEEDERCAACADPEGELQRREFAAVVPWERKRS